MQTKVAIVIILILLVAGGYLTVSSRQEQLAVTTTPMKLTSNVFTNEGTIPSRFTCDDENVNPTLHISDVPEEAQSLVLLMDDPDIPATVRESMGISTFDHWVVFNIPPTTATLEEDRTPPGILGANSAGKNAYTGPCPPKEFEPREHRYFFKLLALDTMLGLSKGATKADVLQAAEGHILDQAVLMGRYERN